MEKIIIKTRVNKSPRNVVIRFNAEDEKTDEKLSHWTSTAVVEKVIYPASGNIVTMSKVELHGNN